MLKALFPASWPVAFAAGVVCYAHSAVAQTLTGDNQPVWHAVTLDFDGPAAAEGDGRRSVGGATTVKNPFLDYRMDVTFTKVGGAASYTVPGYYAVDNTTGADTWRAKFTPDRAGDWNYTINFYEGTGVAVAEAGSLPAPTTTVNSGSPFSVAAYDPGAAGFLGKGRLQHVPGQGKASHYLRTAGDGKYWIKGGADSPENWLGYTGFDSTRTNTGSLHSFTPHGGINGALDYLAEHRVNSIYFLPMNIGGDGRDSYPFLDRDQSTGQLNLGGSANNDNLHYDLSKLEQWEATFQHAQENGIHLHFVLNEAESPNKNELDSATLGTERKLFYRELVARFGHHNAVQWNISEEYNRGTNLGEAKVNQFAAYIDSLDAYDHPTTVHNGNIGGTAGPSGTGQRNEVEPFIDADWFDLTSYQNYGERGIGDEVEYFRARSQTEGRPIAVMVDEPESLDALTADQVRKEMTWDIYLGGGGVEWFVRGKDQSLEDFSQFETVWDQTWYARKFLEENTPFWEMDSVILTPNTTTTPDDDWVSADTLVRGEDSDFGGAEVFFKDGEVYAIYLPDASNDDNNLDGNTAAPPELDLRDHAGLTFTARWYNPRTGQFVGEAFELDGGDWASLGYSPDGFQNTSDWALLVEVIPEPGSVALLGLGGLTVPGRGRAQQA